MSKLRKVSVIFVSLAFCLGCLEEPDGSTADCAEPPCSGQSAPSDRSNYPGFGTSTSDILAPLTFKAGSGDDYSIAEVFADSNNRVMLLTTSAGWCTACIEEQPTLQALHEEFSDRGLFIMVALFETRDYQPANSRLAERWKAQYELDYAVVADPGFVMEPYYPNGDSSVTPIVLMVDVDTMEIIEIMVGFNEPAVRAIITNNL
jgi:thiol-disulfide isomerase/thioredoxin